RCFGALFVGVVAADGLRVGDRDGVLAAGSVTGSVMGGLVRFVAPLGATSAATTAAAAATAAFAVGIGGIVVRGGMGLVRLIPTVVELLLELFGVVIVGRLVRDGGGCGGARRKQGLGGLQRMDLLGAVDCE